MTGIVNMGSFAMRCLNHGGVWQHVLHVLYAHSCTMFPVLVSSWGLYAQTVRITAVVRRLHCALWCCYDCRVCKPQHAYCLIDMMSRPY